MLTLPLDELQNAVKGAVGKELLAELCAANWEQPVFHSVAALGVAYGCATGSKRARNEDRVAVAHVAALNQVRYTIAVLCDGVGGSESGDAAATVAVAALVGGLAEARGGMTLELILKNLVYGADEAVRRALRGQGATTLSVLAVSSLGEFAAANVGDSRIFAWTPGERTFEQISVDDTFENELRGKDPSALAAHGLQGRLTQAIGEGGRESADLFVNLLSAASFPAGAILASDGAWKVNPAAFDLINIEAQSAPDAVRRAMAFAGWVGGVDNTSVLAIENLDAFRSNSPQRLAEERLHSSVRVTVWFAGRTLVISHSFAGPGPELGYPAVQRQEEALTKDKQKRKAGGRRKVEAREANAAEPELDLDVERQDEQNRPDKPELEISTDEKTANKA